mmetsp:Transcript_17194/g.23252  ORF Transcript_17194/g.23252 Transcript_17194/m.23252 type:complete len:203 (+) Transcript_17194:137-745(+)
MSDESVKRRSSETASSACETRWRGRQGSAESSRSGSGSARRRRRSRSEKRRSGRRGSRRRSGGARVHGKLSRERRRKRAAMTAAMRRRQQKERPKGKGTGKDRPRRRTARRRSRGAMRISTKRRSGRRRPATAVPAAPAPDNASSTSSWQEHLSLYSVLSCLLLPNGSGAELPAASQRLMRACRHGGGAWSVLRPGTQGMPP